MVGLTIGIDITTLTSGLTDSVAESPDSAMVVSQTSGAELEDWRRPFMDYLRGASGLVEWKICRWAINFTLVDNELYHHTLDGLLFKVFGS